MGSAQRICYNRWWSHLLGTTWLNRHRSIGKALACPSRGTIGSGQLFVRTLPHNTERRSPTDKVTGRAAIVQPLQAQRIAQNQPLLRYQAAPVTDAIADHALLSMYRKDIIGVQRIADVLEQWERAAHDWGDKTAWRLSNAATFALAGKVAEKPDLTKELHRLSTRHT
jgi:hypothetical protein